MWLSPNRSTMGVAVFAPLKGSDATCDFSSLEMAGELGPFIACWCSALLAGSYRRSPVQLDPCEIKATCPQVFLVGTEIVLGRGNAAVAECSGDHGQRSSILEHSGCQG